MSGDALQTTCYPLGFPVLLETNSPDVLEAAVESWQFFSQEVDASPLTLSCIVIDKDGSLPDPPKFKFDAHLMSITSDADNFLICDLDGGVAFGSVTSALIADRAFFRYHFLDAAILTLIEQRYLAPIHGALVAANGHGILLCGESLAGKSTLAYACARAGWAYISDDASFLVRDAASLYAIGDSHRLRLRPDARRFFPELARWQPHHRPNGKETIEIKTSDVPIRTAKGSSVDHVVLLNRHEGQYARLQPYPSSELLAWCQQNAAYGSESVRAAKAQTYQLLGSAGIWQMSYSDLGDAMRCLDLLVGRLG